MTGGAEVAPLTAVLSSIKVFPARTEDKDDDSAEKPSLSSLEVEVTGYIVYIY